MEDFLPSVAAVVDPDGGPPVTPRFSATSLATSKSRLTIVSGNADLLQVRDVLPGDDEYMNGRLAIYVFGASTSSSS